MRLRVAAAFFPAATRFGDFREVLLRAVVRLRAGAFRAEVRLRELEALRAAAVLRFREAAAFFPAATRFGDFRDVAFRAVVRFREVEALRAAVVLRLREAAAFFPAATRFGDFRDVAFRAVVRFRVVAAFRAAVVLRLRDAAAFFPAATRFGDFRDAALRAVVRFLAGPERGLDVVLRRVAGRDCSVPDIGDGVVGGIIVVSVRGVGRSHAGVSGCQDGSGALGASSEPPSAPSRSCVASEAPSRSSQGQSLVLRSIGAIVRPPRLSVTLHGRRRPLFRLYPESRRSMHTGTADPQVSRGLGATGDRGRSSRSRSPSRPACRRRRRAGTS